MRMRQQWRMLFVLATSILSMLLASCGGSSEGLRVYPKAVGAADEGYAIQALRTIATAQAQLKVTRGGYGDFASLTNAGLLDARFASEAPNLKGYRFTISASDSEFSVNADPNKTETQPTTGVRHFFLESSDNAIHAHPSRAATRDDPVLQ